MPEPLVFQAEADFSGLTSAYDQARGASVRAAEGGTAAMRALSAASDRFAAQLEIATKRADNLRSALERARAVKPPDFSVGMAGGLAALEGGAFGGADPTKIAALETALDKTNLAALRATEGLAKVEVAQERLTAKSAPAVAGVGRVQTALDKVHPSAAEAGQGLDLFGGAMGRVFGSFLLYRGFTTVVEGLGAVSKEIVDAPAQMEQYRVAFANMTGGLKEGDALLAKIAAYSQQTPFNLQGLDAATQRLLAARIAGEQVLPILTAVGDVIAAYGKGQPEYDKLIKALTDVQAKGHLAGEEMRQMSNVGVNAITVLSETLGITRQKAQDLVSAGQISTKVFFDAFEQWSAKNYGGVARAQGASFKGLAENIGEVGFVLASAFGKDFLEIAEARLRSFLQYIQTPQVAATIADWGSKFGAVTTAAFTFFDQAGRAATAFAASVKPATDAIGALLGTLPTDQAAISAGEQRIADAAKGVVVAFHEQEEGAVNVKTALDIQQDALTRLQRTAEDIRSEAEKDLDLTRQKITLLDRTYAAQGDARKLADLQAKITADTGLARDYYSETGKSARDRLSTEKEQLANLQAEIAHRTTRNGLEDAIKAKEKERDDALEKNRLAQRGVQDAIERIRDAQIAGNTILEKTPTLWQNIHDKIAAAVNVLTGGRGAEPTTVTGAVDSLNTKLQTVQSTLNTLLGTDFMGFIGQIDKAGSQFGNITRSAKEAAIFLNNPEMFGAYLSAKLGWAPWNANTRAIAAQLDDAAAGNSSSGPWGNDPQRNSAAPGTPSLTELRGRLAAAQKELDRVTHSAAYQGGLLGALTSGGAYTSYYVTTAHHKECVLRDSIRQTQAQLDALTRPAAPFVPPAPAGNGRTRPLGGNDERGAAGSTILGQVQINITMPGGEVAKRWIDIHARDIARAGYKYAAGAGA